MRPPPPPAGRPRAKGEGGLARPGLLSGRRFHSRAEGSAACRVRGGGPAGRGGARSGVALLAGNHDPLGEGSVWTRARFESTCDNVTFFGSEPQVVVFQDLDLTVIGQSGGPGG